MAQEVAPTVALLDDVYTKTTTTCTTVAELEAAEATTTLGCLLSNHLVLSQTLPYLPPSGVLSLAATSRAFRDLIYTSPATFRHLDLTHVKTAQFDIDPIDTGTGLWHNTQLDEHLTEDEFYSGPLRGIFSNLSRSNLLSSVHTLVLDGLSVTAELVHDILTGPSFRIRVLSLRDVKNLNERKLQQALTTACRPSRPEGTPHLKAIYLFTPRDSTPPSASSSSSRASAGLSSESSSSTSAGSAPTSSLQPVSNASSPDTTASPPAGSNGGDAWYGKRGKMLNRGTSREWAHTLLACQGIIAFDAVLCAGPRHPNSPAFGKVSVSEPAAGTDEPHQSQWAVATHALGECAGCRGAPEGVTVWGRNDAPHDYPLLAPAPLHSSSVKAACRPSGASLEAREPVSEWRGGSSSSGTVNGNNEGGSHCGPPRFVARCFDCLKGRYCWSCNKWWCESCYAGPGDGNGGGANDKRGVTKSCWECGDNCHECISKTQLMCKSCCGGYCIIHNEGSGPKHCDWCSKGSRRTRDLY